MLAEDGRHIHYVSSGSVGKPKDGDPRACWVEVVIGSAEQVETAAGSDASAECAAGGSWVGVLAHRVAYDAEGAAKAVLASGLPPRLAGGLLTG